MGRLNAGSHGGLRRVTFSSDDLPAELDDQARFRVWHDMFNSLLGEHDVTRDAGGPFHVRCEFSQVGEVMLADVVGTISRFVQPADSGSEDLILGINGGGSPIEVDQAGREARLMEGSATLIARCETAIVRRGAGDRQLALRLPRGRLIELAPWAEDRITDTIASGHPAVRHLNRYLEVLLGPDSPEEDPLLSELIASTLIDLVALALGARSDAAALARMRGVRAARLQIVLAEINAGFADVAFSIQDLAIRVGLSPRYVQDLLHDAGASFTQRVAELRLQKARRMLAQRRCDRMKVSDIAYASGFSEVSHFNRCFRRRFGLSPSDLRTGAC
jgi:AraC-like DNA-binding protein